MKHPLLLALLAGAACLPEVLVAQCAPTDTLEHWVSHALPASNGLVPSAYHLDVADANTIWALGIGATQTGSQNNTLWARSTDGGCTWQSGLVSATMGEQQFSIAAASATTACAVTFDQAGLAHVFRTTDGGQSWSNPMPAGAFPAPAGFADFIHFFNPNDGVVCGDVTGSSFEIYTTSDGGASWTRVPAANLPALPDEIAFVASLFSAVGDTIWAPTLNGRVFRSVDKGLTWTSSEPFPAVAPFTINTWRIAFRDALHGLYYTNSQGVWRTSDGGTSWQAAPPQPDYGFGLTAIPGTKAYFLHTAWPFLSGDDGATWVPLDSFYLNEAKFISPETGWAGGRVGDMLEWHSSRKIIGGQLPPNIAATTRRQATAFQRDLGYVGLANTATDLKTDWTLTRDGLPFQSDSKTVQLPTNGAAQAKFEFLPTTTGKFEIETKGMALVNGETVFQKKSRLAVSDTLISKGDLAGNTEKFALDASSDFGTQLDLIQNDTLTGLSVWYAGSDAGAPAVCKIRFSVYGFSPGSAAPDLLLYQSPLQSLTAANANSWAFQPLAAPLILPAGKYVLTVHTTYTASNFKYHYFGASLDQWELDRWVLVSGSWSHSNDNFDCFVLRAHFNPAAIVAVKNPDEQALSIEVSPNPTPGSLTVSAFFEKTAAPRLHVFDVNGRLVYEKNSTATGRAWQETLDFTDFPKGIYLINLVSGNRIGNARVIKY